VIEQPVTWKCETVHDKPLRSARSEEEYLIHQAALDWSLADCIVIHSREDMQSEANWRDRLKPFDHQVQNLLTFCRRLPVTLLADDVGLGKTISAGLILSELMVRRRVSRTLVLCPKILCPQWVEELGAKFGIQGRVAIGSELDAELKFGLANRAAVLVTTYESAADRLATIPPAAFDMLILDEAHKLRNLHGGAKPPKMATRVRDALQGRLFKFVVMLTATPIQNRVWDLYSLIDCLAVAKGHKNPLGTPDEFKQVYLLPGSDGRQLRPAYAERFRRILRQYIARTRRGDARLLFPTREVSMRRVDLLPQEDELNRLVAGQIAGLNGLQQTSLAQALMSSPQALAAQLQNMASGSPALNGTAMRARQLADACPTPAKLRLLLLLCEELQSRRPDWRVVVFTHRKETQEVIGDAFARRNIPVGFIRGGQAPANQRAIEAFRVSPPRVPVLVSTDAGAEGINLQAGNVLVNYDLPWNPMILEQRIGRLQRLASEHQHVVVYNLVAARNAEEKVVARLMEKLQGVAQSIGDIESILESSKWKGSGDGFEAEMRSLVVKSLLGQDIEHATQLAQDSIERARQLIDEGRDEMNRKLGHLGELHKAGPETPRLERTPPSVSPHEFAIRARRAEGGSVREDSPGVYEVKIQGRLEEVMVFDEATAEVSRSKSVFMGKVRLYQPGKADFERLVQHWVDRCGHRVCDLRPLTETNAERLARSWCQAIPEVRLLGYQIMGKAPQFQGTSRLKVKAGNGVDGYEKFLSSNHFPEGHCEVRSTADPAYLLLQEIRFGEVHTAGTASVAKAAEADRDVAEFCRFYEARRTEELAAAGDDPRLRHKVNEDFTPTVTAEVVGFQGVRYDEVRLRIRFTVCGEGEDAADLLAVPASEQILEQPRRMACEQTRLGVPVDCLDRCQVTGKRVLKHLLATSEASGRRGLRERSVTCEVTAKLCLDDEVARSGMSGKVALKSAMEACQETGCLLLPSEAGTSAVSGKLVRHDLLLRSEKSPHRQGLEGEFGICEVTGRRLLSDELDRSVVSGRRVDRELLHGSASSGRRALDDEFVVCQESGVRFLPDETDVCVVTGKRVDARLLARSEASGTLALARCLEKCASTGKLALPGELETCEVTGSRVLSDELARCAVTGKRALRTLLATCQETWEVILPSEAARSDYSGKLVMSRLLSQSEKPPGRQGLASEFGVCEASGQRLLKDELDRSVVSGKQVAKGLLRPSARSGALALPEEMVLCEETGRSLLPVEVGRCLVSGKVVDSQLLSHSEISGVVALTRLLERCAVSGKSCLPEEMGTCEVTGMRVLPQDLDACSVTGKRVVRSRLVRCARTRQQVLDTEAARSAISGLLVRRDLLHASEKPPHRLGLAEELARCEASGRLLLTDELSRSAVSGKRVDKSLLRPSARSGTLALAEELVRCEESGAELLPAEVGRCQVTGTTVDSRLLSRSEVSETVALARLLHRCAVTNKRCLSGELQTCEVTGVRVVPQELGTCSVTRKRVIRSRLVLCARTNVPVLDIETARSAVSGIVVRKDLLHASQKPPHRLGLAEELVECQSSRRCILVDEAGLSVVSGKRVDRDLLVPSARTGTPALREEMVTCQESGTLLLPTEAGRCSLTGKRVDSRLLSSSQQSGRVALTRLMEKCAVTFKAVLPEELEACGLTGARVLPAELVTCAVTGKRGIRDRMLRSDVSGKFVVPDKAIRSVVSGRIGLPEEAVRCAWLERPILRAEAATCKLTLKKVAATMLNTDGELAILRDMLDGQSRQATRADDLIPRICPLDESLFAGLTHVWIVRSPRGGKMAVCGETRGWLGLKVRFVGLLLKTGEEFEAAGQAVRGYRVGGSWVLEEEWEVSNE